MSEEIYDPRERLEIFLNAVRTGDVEGLPDPQTREEMYLAAIAAKSALPDTADASVGDALVLDDDKKPIWQANDKKSYLHIIKASKSNSYYILTSIVTNFNTPFTYDALYEYLSHLTNLRVPATGWAQPNSTGLKGSVYSLRYMLSPAQIQIEYIKYIFTASTPSLTADNSYIVLDSSTVDDNVIEI